MADVSNISGSGGSYQSSQISNISPAPTYEAQFNQQQEVAYQFLQDQLVSSLAAQKATFPGKG